MDDHAYRSTLRRLDAWGIWARQGRSSLKHCGSLESRYRRPYDEERSEAGAKPLIDAEEALETELAVINLPSPKMRMLLVLVFVEREERDPVCRKLGIAWEMYEPAVRVSVRMVYDRLGATNVLPARAMLRQQLHLEPLKQVAAR